MYRVTSLANVSQGRRVAVASHSHSVRIAYRSAWGKANLHHSVNGGKWSGLPMTMIPTGGGRWTEATIPLEPGATMEFALTDGNSAWDNNEQKNYKITDGPGNYALRHGKLEKVTRPSFMVVSDLDGTLIGNDESLEEFQRFWEGHAIQRRCHLVYSSGRHLGSFQLLKDRLGDRLPFPDMYIGAVGTKIFAFDTAKKELVEDVAWSKTLDKDWNLKTVERAAAEVIQKAGSDSCHLRPAEELNEHKITLGIRTERVEAAMDHLSSTFSREGMKAKLILSGIGEWRYLDIVANGAGKLESLEYVRTKLGYPHEFCVACGDSGNDLLMLSGQSRAIVVGNAQPDLRVWVDRVVAEQPKDPKTGLGRVYLAKKHEAAGVLEGLEKFGWK